MKRRDFLKSIGKVVAGLAVVPSVVAVKAEQSQPHEIDDFIQDTIMSDKEYEAIIRSLMLANQKVVYPKPSLDYDQQQREAIILERY